MIKIRLIKGSNFNYNINICFTCCHVRTMEKVRNTIKIMVCLENISKSIPRHLPFIKVLITNMREHVNIGSTVTYMNVRLHNFLKKFLRLVLTIFIKILLIVQTKTNITGC